MKKLIAFSFLAAMALVMDAKALDATGPAWACGNFGTTGNTSNNAQAARFCVARITSATTATQLGKLTVNPTKQVWSVVSGPAAVNTVTSTLSLTVRGNNAGTLTVTNTAAGITNGFTTPYFDGVTVSVTQPASITGTNGIVHTVIER